MRVVSSAKLAGDVCTDSADLPVAVEANFPLFIIYTSGTTGKPKGIVHAHGFLPGVMMTVQSSFDATPGADVMFVLASFGWITGQSYMVAGALANRVTTLMTQANPVSPYVARFAAMIQEYNVTILKGGVAFLKYLMAQRAGAEELLKFDTATLKVGTFCAEPSSPVVQLFAAQHITPHYINSYWGTEHGGMVLSCAYGNTDQPLKLDTTMRSFPWIAFSSWISTDEAECGSMHRVASRADDPGEAVVTAPWPYMARTTWGDAGNVGHSSWVGDIRRFKDVYFGRFAQPVFVQGDVAILHADGSFSMRGRSDDVLNVNGHRVGTG